MNAQSSISNTQVDVDRLNDLLAELGRLPHDQTSLLLEHLEGARYYMTGAMPKELAMNLEMAENSLDSLPDEGLRQRVRQFIDAHRSV
jgi:hypothetical protein